MICVLKKLTKFRFDSQIRSKVIMILNGTDRKDGRTQIQKIVFWFLVPPKKWVSIKISVEFFYYNAFSC